MDTAQDFVNLFVNSSGELLYFITIFIVYQAALLMALGQRTRSKNEIAAGRYTVGLLIAELAWLTLMAGAMLTIARDTTTDGNILPPLERAVNVVILVGLGWALLSAELDKKPNRLSKSITVLIMLTLVGFGITLQGWNSAIDFNLQSASEAWTIGPLLLSMIGILLLVTRYRSVADIPLKLLFFTVIFLGHAYTLYQLAQNTIEGDAAGAVRWSFLTGSLLVTVLVYRMVIDRMRMTIDEVATYAETISKPIKAIPVQGNNEVSTLSERVTAQTAGTASLGGRNEALELLKALGIMLDEPNTDALPAQIVSAVAQGLKADVVAVMTIGKGQWADIMAAEDTINSHRIDKMLMNLDDQPTMTEALRTKSQKKLSIEENDEELRDLYTRLDIEPIGPAFLQPLSRNNKIMGVLMVGFPYTHRDLRPSDLRLLESIGPIAARLLAITQTAIQQREEAQERAIQAIVADEFGTDVAEENRARSEALQVNLEQSQIQIRELNRLVQELEVDLEKERDRVQELLVDGEDAMSITQRITVISTERHQLREEREKLSNALVDAKASLLSATAGDDVEVFETMIDDLRKEYDDLQSQKEALQNQLEHIRAATDTAGASTKLNELIDSISQEKAQIQADRDILAARLEQTHAQMQSLGIEGGVVGLARQIAQLTEDRLYYKAQAERYMQEREVLLTERRSLEVAIADESQRDARIKTLEDELARIMKDREAISKGRDNLKIERDAFLAERDGWRGERARMLAHNDSLKMELDETLELLRQANQERQELAAQINQFNADNSQLRASFTRTQNERDALLARIEGDRERLREVGVEGVGALTRMIDELTQERADTEKKLMKANEELHNLKWERIQLHETHQGQLLETASVGAETIRAMSQEMVSPLSAITHYADVLLGESVGGLSALQEEFLTRIKANLDRLGNLIGDLVQASGLLESGSASLNPQPLNLVDLIDDTLTSSRHKFSEKGIVLDLDVASDQLQIEADHQALSQVITQLIDNAYQVSPNDGNVRVSARYEHTKDNTISHVLVQISDEGGGVPPNVYDVVFSRINRSDNAMVSGLGHSGVELAILKGLIEAHGGKIWLETQEGVGTTFNFTLPVQFAQQA